MKHAIYVISIGFLACMFPGRSFALPVLNMNSAGAGEVTVFPDHVDRNLYYLAPTVMLVARDESGLPQFSYVEFGSMWDKKALVQTTLRPHFDLAKLNLIKAEILKVNPTARFTGLVFTQAKMMAKDKIPHDLVTGSQCDHRAGIVGDEQDCSFTLNERGMDVLRPQFKAGLTLTLSLEYEVEGVEQEADGKYVKKTNVYEMAGRIGGPDLAQHPELFRDSHGRIIRD